MHDGFKDGSTHARMLLTEREGTLKTKIIRQKKKKKRYKEMT